MNSAKRLDSNIDVERSKIQLHSLLENVGRVIIGKNEQIKLIIAAWLSGGHILIEDIPGTGKTVLVRALAKSVDVRFSRVQFTPDLLPSDILGVSVFDQKENVFRFKPGPMFTTLLLADEINRATPRTQSALLECMSERQVTIDGCTYELSPLFCTIATQNPIDQLGTFSLPEAQLDRFMIKMSMGYPSAKDEISLVKNQNFIHPLDELQAVMNESDLLNLRAAVPQIFISDELYRYAVNLIGKSRSMPEVRLGCSPRATLAICRGAQALALFEGYDYVKPKHLQEMAVPVMCHRLILKAEAKMSGLNAQSVVEKIIALTGVPVKKS